MTRVVIALDSFKGSITAADATAAFTAGWVSVDPSAVFVPRPMADGGEGTLAAFATGIEGSRRMPVRVRGPHGREVAASWLLLPDGTGVVELASTSGIELLGKERLPWDADSFGFGQAIAAALDHGISRLVLGIGSSASTDAGVGMLSALGARMTDAAGRPVAPGARGLASVVSIDLSGLRALPERGIAVLTDVDNPLVGPRGTAAVFGPQKGVALDDIENLDAALGAFAGLVGADPATPGTGAAGGVGFALVLWGAALRPGAAEIAELVGLPGAVRDADLVVTGEGSYDVQSAAGKVPAFVAEIAAKAGVRAALVAGRVDPAADVSAFASVVSLTELAGGSEASLAEPGRWLRVAGAAIAGETLATISRRR